MPEGAPDDEEEKLDEDENGRIKDNLDQLGDDHMFEQFLKSGDYAAGGIAQKRQRSAMMNIQENPEADDGLDDELEFKNVANEPGKRANTEAQFQDFMKFLAEQE